MCSSCQMKKGCKLPFQVSNKKEVILLEKMHSDLCGPAPTASSQRFKYYVIFIDNCTQFI